jgi:lysyl-tRNA synthetase class 2
VASRFELVIDGIEIANGWHELCDPPALRDRYAAEARARAARGLPPQPPDPRLLAAFDAGLPSCAGVALGVDRLAMVAAGSRDIGDVLALGADEGA